jgi:parvulin-like peptidyl-prolyl isomerase
VRTQATALLLAAAAAWCGCGRSGGGKQSVPQSVALVNGESISAADLRRELARSRDENAESEPPSEPVKTRILEGMIDRVLLLQQARERSVAVGQDQVERAFLRLRSEYPGSNFDDLLAEERLSAAELKTRIKDQLTVEKLFSDEVFSRVQVAEEEVRRHYQEHPQEFEQPERVHVLQVVVKTKEEAQKIREELQRKPQTFGDVARRASIAPEGKDGGDLGYFGKGSGMPEVFDVCFKLGVNSLSEVTPSPYGFHVFKVVDRKPAGRRTFEQTRSEILTRLLRERRAHAQEEYLSAIRARSKIKVDQATLSAVTP